MFKFIAVCTLFVLNVAWSLNIGVPETLNNKHNITAEYDATAIIGLEDDLIEKSPSDRNESSLLPNDEFIETNDKADDYKSKIIIFNRVRPVTVVLNFPITFNANGSVQNAANVSADDMNTHTKK